MPDVSGTGKAEADVKETQTPEFSYYIRINRKQNCVTIYTQDEEGEYTVPYKAMVCSTGLYNATPRGTYQISTKYLWRVWAVRDADSRGNPVPFCALLQARKGYTLYGQV